MTSSGTSSSLKIKRKRTCDLKNYPSEEEVICAWKEGAEMARQLARTLGMSPNASEHEDETTDGNDDASGETWFYKPLEFVNFKDSLWGMETEEEQGTLRREAREQ